MKVEDTLSINGETLSLFIENKEIKERVTHLAESIKKDMGDEIPLFLCVLNGAFIFASDLVRAYEGNCNISFIRMSSYSGTQSTGNVKTVLGITDNLVGRSVVIVEDIIDSGLTMKQLKEQLATYRPKQIRVATLFLKPENLKYDVKVDYHCFEIPNKFIVGYGLDYDGLYRNLPSIYTK